MKRITVGVDVGGTWARVGLLVGERLVAEDRFPSGEAGTAERLLTRIDAVAGRLAAQAGVRPEAVAGLGLAVPGVIRLADGVVLAAPNCRLLVGADLPSLAARRLSWPTVIANDADCAAWAEHRLGSHGSSGLVYITVSTGIGGGIVSNGRLLAGEKTTAAEVGHMIVSLGGPRCPCGSRGCVEALASGRAVAAAYRRETGRRIGSEAVYTRAAAGERAAAAVVAAASEALAALIASLHRLLGLPIVIGGGVTLAGEAFWTPLRSRLSQLRRRPDLHGLRVEPASLPEHRGILGAGLLAAAPLALTRSLGYPLLNEMARVRPKGGGHESED